MTPYSSGWILQLALIATPRGHLKTIISHFSSNPGATSTDYQLSLAPDKIGFPLLQSPDKKKCDHSEA
jgi:hypothetical protein